LIAKHDHFSFSLKINILIICSILFVTLLFNHSQGKSALTKVKHIKFSGCKFALPFQKKKSKERGCFFDFEQEISNFQP